MNCLLGTLRKVWIKQRRFCFVLRSLLIRGHAKLASYIFIAMCPILATFKNAYEFSLMIE